MLSLVHRLEQARMLSRRTRRYADCGVKNLKILAYMTAVLRSLWVEPNECEISNALTLEVTFDCNAVIATCSWKIDYIVDVAEKRIPISLLEQEACEYAAGVHTHVIQLESIDVSSLQDYDILNVSILQVRLIDSQNEKELLAANIVTRTFRNEADNNKIYRVMYNPL